MVERNMGNAAMRGVVALPGSRATSRAKGSHRNLGGLASGRRRGRGRRSASGRRGAVADDARTREVGLRHSSCEAGEQSGAIRCGAGGAKGGDQGECGPAKHAPGAEPGISVSQALERIRQVARERKKERFTALFHHISIDLLEEAFYELKENAAPGVDRLTWTGLRGRPRAQSRGFARSGPSGSVSGTAEPASVHTQAGRTAAPARGRRPGGQDRPTGDGRAAERDLRGRLPRLLVWVPARTRHA